MDCWVEAGRPFIHQSIHPRIRFYLRSFALNSFSTTARTSTAVAVSGWPKMTVTGRRSCRGHF